MPRPYFSLEAPGSGSDVIDGAARLAAQAAAWHRRHEEKARARAEFAEARRHGLAARHATKLARLRTARLLATPHQPPTPASPLPAGGARTNPPWADPAPATALPPCSGAATSPAGAASGAASAGAASGAVPAGAAAEVAPAGPALQPMPVGPPSTPACQPPAPACPPSAPAASAPVSGSPAAASTGVSASITSSGVTRRPSCTGPRTCRRGERPRPTGWSCQSKLGNHRSRRAGHRSDRVIQAAPRPPPPAMDPWSTRRPARTSCGGVMPARARGNRAVRSCVLPAVRCRSWHPPHGVGLCARSADVCRLLHGPAGCRCPALVLRPGAVPEPPGEPGDGAAVVAVGRGEHYDRLGPPAPGVALGVRGVVRVRARCWWRGAGSAPGVRGVVQRAALGVGARCRRSVAWRTEATAARLDGVGEGRPVGGG